MPRLYPRRISSPCRKRYTIKPAVDRLKRMKRTGNPSAQEPGMKSPQKTYCMHCMSTWYCRMLELRSCRRLSLRFIRKTVRGIISHMHGVTVSTKTSFLNEGSSRSSVTNDGKPICSAVCQSSFLVDYSIFTSMLTVRMTLSPNWMGSSQTAC